MPMLDAYIPRGALTETAEANLLATLTDLLIHNEGMDPADPLVRSLCWIFLHRSETVYVAGAVSAPPRYKFVASVPEGQFNSERRQAVVASITAAVLDAENGAYAREPQRIWVFTPEIPDGTWGFGGQIGTLADLQAGRVGRPG